MRCLWIIFVTAVCYLLFLLNCMILQRTPHMLKTLGINKLRKPNILPGIHRPNRPCLCWKAGCCKATWRNWQERKPACTHCGQLTDSLNPQNIFLYFELIPVYFCLYYFWRFDFTHPILEHHYVLSSRLFDHVDNISDPMQTINWRHSFHQAMTTHAIT